MRNTNIYVFLFTIILFISTTYLGSCFAYSLQKDTTYISVETIHDKIKGGLLGQLLGNLNGLPHEFEYYEEPGNLKNYIPALPDGAWTDDDTDVEWLYIYEMQKKRKPLLSSDEIFAIWKERINDRIWNSNRYARYLMDIGIKPPFTGYTPLNPWAGFNISGMFSSETFGLVAPAMPQTAATIGLNYTTVAISGEPAQQTQLFTTMISTAFVENDVNEIIESGMAALDEKSILLQIIKDVKDWHSQYPENWRETRGLLIKKYLQKGGSVRNTRDNNGYELHTGFAIAALLYGEGNFQETLKVAFNLGLDADNTAAMAGTIVGVTYGYRRMIAEENWQIVDRYSNTTRENMPEDETITSFAERVIDLFEIVNQQNGGREIIVDKVPVYEISVENPAPITNLSSTADQEKELVAEFIVEIENHLLDGNREERARAVYLAVCLDIYDELSEEHPELWKQGVFDLSGYWKVMNNIFYGGEFLDHIKKKFIPAGFKAPKRSYSNNELWHDLEYWKAPEGIY